MLVKGGIGVVIILALTITNVDPNIWPYMMSPPQLVKEIVSTLSLRRLTHYASQCLNMWTVMYFILTNKCCRYEYGIFTQKASTHLDVPRNAERLFTNFMTPLICTLRIWVIKNICLWFKMVTTQRLISYSTVSHPWNITLRPSQNGRHFPNDIFRCIFLN